MNLREARVVARMQADISRVPQQIWRYDGDTIAPAFFTVHHVRWEMGPTWTRVEELVQPEPKEYAIAEAV